MKHETALKLVEQLDGFTTEILLTVQWLIAEKLLERLVLQDKTDKAN